MEVPTNVAASAGPIVAWPTKPGEISSLPAVELAFAVAGTVGRLAL